MHIFVVLELLWLIVLLLIMKLLLVLVGVKRGYYPGATIYDEEEGFQYLNGYTWQERSIYNDLVDGDIRCGGSRGFLRRLFVASPWYNGSNCGTRSIDCGCFSAHTISSVSVRGCNKREYPGASWKDNETHLDGYHWQELPVYKEPVDSSKYGSSSGLLRRLIVDGHWGHGSYCGSRSVICDSFSTATYGTFSSRGCNTATIILGRNGMV